MNKDNDINLDKNPMLDFIANLIFMIPILIILIILYFIGAMFGGFLGGIISVISSSIIIIIWVVFKRNRKK